MPVTTGIVIAGAGFAGLGMAIALKKAGFDDFVDPDGINRALWPGFSFEYWARTRRARQAAYVVTAPRPAAAVAR